MPMLNGSRATSRPTSKTKCGVWGQMLWSQSGRSISGLAADKIKVRACAHLAPAHRPCRYGCTVVTVPLVIFGLFVCFNFLISRQKPAGSLPSAVSLQQDTLPPSHSTWRVALTQLIASGVRSSSKVQPMLTSLPLAKLGSADIVPSKAIEKPTAHKAEVRRI